MRKLLLIFVTLLLLAAAGESQALRCKEQDNDGAAEYWQRTINVNTNISIPSEMPRGTLVWRAPEYTVRIRCWLEWNMPRENIYIYLDNRELGNNLALGVIFTGQFGTKDFRCPDGEVQCKVNTGLLAYYCSGQPCGYGVGSNYTISYTAYFYKKSQSSTGVPPPSLNPGKFKLFQFDGEGGINTTNPSYYVSISGLNNIRILECASQVKIEPSMINFGAIGVSSTLTDVGHDFTISSSKSCNATYGLNGYLTPTAATLADSNTTLVPNNNSVGIQLFDAQQQTAVPFLKEFVLVPSTSATTASKRFTAKLKWMPVQKKTGEFNAGATLDIFYK